MQKHNTSQWINILKEIAKKYLTSQRGNGSCIKEIEDALNALAFRCNIMPYFCAARVPHITICTFRGGVPKYTPVVNILIAGVKL